MPYSEKVSEQIIGTFMVRSTLHIDEDVEDPMTFSDCNGTLHRFERGGYGHNDQIHETYKDDPFALRIQRFEHGNVVYSLAGEGPQCEFDTTKYAGYWVCDGNCRANYDSVLAEKGLFEAQKWLREAGRTILEEFTSWANGDCWSTDVQVFENGEELEELRDQCGGYVGRSYAETCLKESADVVTKQVEAMIARRLARLKHWLAKHGIYTVSDHDVEPVRRYLYTIKAREMTFGPQYRYGNQDTAEQCLAMCNMNQQDQLVQLVDLDGKGPDGYGAPVPFQIGYTLAVRSEAVQSSC
jgi:hypothetical protein